MFQPSTYSSRRTHLKDQMDSGILLFLGNSESPMNYADNTYPFRQDSSFLYFFGLDAPDLAGLIDLDEERQIIFGDELTMDHIVWMGNLPSIKERAQAADIYDTQPMSNLKIYLQKAIKANRPIHYLPPYRAENQLKLADLLGKDPFQVASGVSEAFIKSVVEMRAIKTEEEIVQIEEAVNITVDMHLAAMKMTKPGMTENDIAAEMQRIALASGGNLSFPVIATVHGETLHNHYHGNVLKPGDLFLLDAGAENAMHYAGDLSSTFPVSSKFTEKQKLIYCIALQAHQSAVNSLAPGIKNLDVHLNACRVLTEGLKDLGLMKGNVEDAVQAGAHALFFPCGTGHMMGLDVHDMEDLGEVYVGYEGHPKFTEFGLKSLRLARPLKAGFVLTIEPGIYFIPQLIDMWQGQRKFLEFLNYDKIEAFRDFGGIRNEEDYLITNQGKRLLGKQKPKTIEEVEALRG